MADKEKIIQINIEDTMLAKNTTWLFSIGVIDGDGKNKLRVSWFQCSERRGRPGQTERHRRRASRYPAIPEIDLFTGQ